MVSIILRKTLRQAVCLWCSAALLVSCGGGVDSGGTGSYVAGPITGYGSIVVGGVHYDESQADVRDEFGVAGTPADLQLGMFTEIQASAPMGTADAPTATASSVRYRSEIVGPVETIDAPTLTFRTLGLNVKVGASTVFDSTLAGGLTALQVGDVVEVFGQFDALLHRYTATRVQRKTGAASYKLRGLVTGLDTVAKTLVIGGQTTIGYGGVASLPALALGQTLRVRLQTTKSGSVWVATSVDVGVSPVPDRDNIEVEGRITAFTSITRFDVDGTPVTTDAATLFPSGSSGVVLGAHVEIKGVSRNGTLIASKVNVNNDSRPEDFELSGNITALDSATQTFVLHRALRSFTVHYSGTTRFEGITSASDLRDGREAEVRGVLSSDGTKLDASFIHVEL